MSSDQPFIQKEQEHLKYAADHMGDHDIHAFSREMKQLEKEFLAQYHDRQLAMIKLGEALEIAGVLPRLHIDRSQFAGIGDLGSIRTKDGKWHNGAGQTGTEELVAKADQPGEEHLKGHRKLTAEDREWRYFERLSPEEKAQYLIRHGKRSEDLAQLDDLASNLSLDDKRDLRFALDNYKHSDPRVAQLVQDLEERYCGIAPKVLPVEI